MNDINPIKNPISIQNNFSFFWFLLFLAFFVLLFALWLLFKKEKPQKNQIKNQKTEKKPNRDLCAKYAISELNEISEKDYKKLAFDLSFLLKKFLSCVYDYDFTSLTVSEILANKKIKKNQKDKLFKILKNLEEIEFSAKPRNHLPKLSKKEIKNTINAFS